MIERRRRVRRAICGGIVLGAAAALPLALLECGYVGFVRDSAARPIERLQFGLYALPLLLLAGALLGGLLGSVAAAVLVASSRLARRHASAPRWTARLYTALATGPIALACAMAFQGRRARTLPGKDLLALGLGMASVAVFYVVTRLGMRAKEHIGRGVIAKPKSLLIATALVGLAAGLYVADQQVLPRLYPFFHVALAVLAFLASELGVGAAYLALRSYQTRVRRLAEPSFAIMVLLATAASGFGALAGLCRAEALRAIVFERSALASKMVRVAIAAHLAPARAGYRTSLSGEPLDQPATLLAAGPRMPGADLVLITVDALRADHVGAYGYSRPTTPSIDAEARHAVVFERAYAQVPHTSFSLATLLCGKYIYSLAALGDAARHETLADVLRRYRYKTAAFFPPSVFFTDEKKFTTYQESRFDFEYVKFEYLDAQKRVDQIIDFLETEKPGRTFVWVHFFEPHEPYETHEGISFGRDAMDRYDGEIAYVDQSIGRLLAYIHRTRPRAVVAITADHGEEFGEHGGRYHGTSLYDEQVHVPMIVSAPEVAPRRVGGPVEVVDLPVTLLTLLDITPSARMRGTDLGPWLADAPASESLMPPAFAEIESKKMIAEDGKKLICDTLREYCELFDLVHDPAEHKNEIGTQVQIAAPLRARLDSWLASHSRLELSTEFHGEGEMRRRAIDRGRLGDRSVVRELATLVLDGDAPPLRKEAARLLASLGPDEGTRNMLARAIDDPDVGPWVAVVVGASCDAAARERIRRIPLADVELAARAGIALAECKDVSALPALKAGLKVDNIIVRRQVLLALGRLQDERALPVLLAQLQDESIDPALDSNVICRALGLLGSEKAIPDLTHRLKEDAYVTVRQEAATALGRIGGAQAVAALRDALEHEKEAQVRADIVAALWQRGALDGAVAGGTGRLRAQKGELWVGVDNGAQGSLTVTRPEQAKASMELQPGVRAYRFNLPPGVWPVEVQGPAVFLYAR